MEIDKGDGQKEQLEVPMKILWHLPIIPRLQRLFMTEKSTKHGTRMEFDIVLTRWYIQPMMKHENMVSTRQWFFLKKKSVFVKWQIFVFKKCLCQVQRWFCWVPVTLSEESVYSSEETEVEDDLSTVDRTARIDRWKDKLFLGIWNLSLPFIYSASE